MGAVTGISWTQATWNPLRGCSRVSEGCRHCYAEQFAARATGYRDLVRKVGDEWRWTGEVRLVEEALTLPLRWRAPKRIFVNSMSDLFHESVGNDTIAAIFGVMNKAEHHTFQVLTKRPDRMLRWFRWVDESSPCVIPGCENECRVSTCHRAAVRYPEIAKIIGRRWCGSAWPLPNVHLGVSVEHQAAADERIPLLLQTPAAVRWVSAEPLLGPVELRPWLPIHPVGWNRMSRHLSWIVAGGESGPGHRPMDLAWLESIADQCTAASVPLFIKQDSGPRPGMQGRIQYALWARKEFPA